MCKTCKSVWHEGLKFFLDTTVVQSATLYRRDMPDVPRFTPQRGISTGYSQKETQRMAPHTAHVSRCIVFLDFAHSFFSQSPNKYDADMDSPGSMYSAGSTQSSASTYSFSQGPSSPYGAGLSGRSLGASSYTLQDSPRNPRGPPWTPEKQSFFYAL
jgi:hypothetical protein